MNKIITPKTECEITNQWQYTDKIYISCVCITYNQEKYIQNTLDSMLTQKCNYKFEIIIHDDYSTDNTRSILQEYKRKYPNIIKLVLQNENQYSKEKKIFPLATQHATGEYIALCEGDDFWVDSYKLQKQLNALLKKPEIDICFTRAYIGTPQKYRKYCDYGKIEKIFTSSEVVRGGGGFMPTASLMIKSEVIKNLPQFYYDAPVGDYPLQIYASLKGGALYLPDITTFYRENALGSYTRRQHLVDNNELLNQAQKYINFLADLSKYGIDEKDIRYAQAKEIFSISRQLFLKKNYSDFKLLIEKSWKLYPKLHSDQKLFYKYKDKISWLLIRTKIRRIKKLMNEKKRDLFRFVLKENYSK